MIEHIITIGAPSVIALSIVRLVLMLQPMPGKKLPPPAKIGLPSGRLAAPSAVHVALGGGRKRRWRK